MNRILVIATRQIGDVLLTTPLIRAARLRWPEARLDVLGFAGTLGMLRGNPDVDALIESPARLGWSGALALIRRLWRQYDLALVTQEGDRAHLLGWIAAPCRSGILPGHGGSNWWKRRLLRHAVAAAGDRGNVHVVTEKLKLLTPWTPALPAHVPVIEPAGAAVPPHIERHLRPGRVVVHAPSMWPYKQWPLPHFRQLVSSLLAQGHQVVLTGGPGGRDRECVDALVDLAPPPALLDLAGQLDFNQLVSLLRTSALYIGPDTSVSHLAAASGVPTLALFGPTNPLRWAPWPAGTDTPVKLHRAAAAQALGNVVILQGSPACVPCGRAGCEDHRQSRSDCLVSITPERVMQQAAVLLARGRARA